MATLTVPAAPPGHEAISNLRKIAEDVRRSIQPGLSGGSDGACLHASLLLCCLINKFHGEQYQADLKGGSGELELGALGTDGRWHGHYWVEISQVDGPNLILDITADQFGYPAVFVDFSQRSVARYRAGEQREVDVAAVELAESFGDVTLAKLSFERIKQGT